MEFGRWAEVMPSLMVSGESAVQKHNIVLELWLLLRVQVRLIDRNVRIYQNFDHYLTDLFFSMKLAFVYISILEVYHN
jgi:hypothetical protein